MSHSTWCNPPPPGIDMDEESKHSTMSSSKSATGSIIDIIDPFIKNPEYIKYKKSLSKERHHRRSRSRSHDRYRSRSRERKKRRRSRSRDYRSRSRGRRRRSRSKSRSRGHRRRHHTSSSSRSRSSSYDSYRHKTKKKHSHSKKRSRSVSQSRRHKNEKTRSRRSPSDSHSEINTSFIDNDLKDEEEEVDPAKDNAFKNDGSFLEMFKKMQEEKEKQEKEAAEAGSSEPKKILPAFGKRRGGRVLKTGKVEKTKTSEDDELANAQDPWSIYLKEVKKYKEACCDDDSKTRPLVK